MKKPMKRYDASFKRDAVELLLTSGKPPKALAIELGVCNVTLRNWRDWHLGRVTRPNLDARINRQRRLQPPLTQASAEIIIVAAG